MFAALRPAPAEQVKVKFSARCRGHFWEVRLRGLRGTVCRTPMTGPQLSGVQG
jgi:hypothetical protein